MCLLSSTLVSCPPLERDVGLLNERPKIVNMLATASQVLIPRLLLVDGGEKIIDGAGPQLRLLKFKNHCSK